MTKKERERRPNFSGWRQARESTLYRRERGILMKMLELQKASRPLKDYTDNLHHDALILMSGQTPVAALIGLEGMDAESLALSIDPDIYAMIARSRQEFRMGKTLSFEQMQAEVAKME